jgi:glucose-6-phosphate-specific signal transduction histidine kinase
MSVPASAMLLVRMLLTLMVVAAAWRFGLRGVLAVLLAVVAIIVLSKAGRIRRDLED